MSRRGCGSNSACAWPSASTGDGTTRPMAIGPSRRAMQPYPRWRPSHPLLAGIPSSLPHKFAQPALVVPRGLPPLLDKLLDLGRILPRCSRSPSRLLARSLLMPAALLFSTSLTTPDLLIVEDAASEVESVITRLCLAGFLWLPLFPVASDVFTLVFSLLSKYTNNINRPTMFGL